MRNSVLAIAFLLSFGLVGAAQQTTIHQVPIKTTPWASGQQMYHQYCAACHGTNADGAGPAAAACTVKPADLRMLAKTHGGKFPYDHFYTVLQFGTQPPTLAHGSVDMPIWLPLLSSLGEGEGLTEQRMHNIARYVASLQSK